MLRKEILLAHFPRITVKRYQELLTAFFSIDEAWHTTQKDLIHIGWDEKLVKEFISWRNNCDEEKIEKILEQQNIHCITQEDTEYPTLLKKIYDPPFCLFVRGSIPHDIYPLAVVGTRKADSYGKQIIYDIIEPLIQKGFTIVSGLAHGIDAYAHISALDNNAPTIAVLGSGCNDAHIYPASHRDLAQNIVEKKGAVLSEYPPGALPNKFTFPRRNRIIAGISLATLVVQAGEKSGALITASCSMDNGRDVFAIPHNIGNPLGIGPNKLIQQGAQIIMTAQDIIDALDLQELPQYVTNKKILPTNSTETTILGQLTKEAQHIDEIIKQSQLNSAEVMSTLTLLEMKGMVKNLGNMMYIIAY